MSFHSPPSDADGPPPLDADPRNDPEPLPQGCQPFGSEAARDDEPLMASVAGAAAISESGTYVPAELRA